MMSVSVEFATEELRTGAETELFGTRIRNFVPQSNIFSYSPAANGQRFLVNMTASDVEPTLNVISSWQSIIRRTQE
jgi:hypothetical protein